MLLARTLISLTLLTLLPSAGSSAQQDPLHTELVPPEVIMTHQRALDISEAQRQQIKALVADAQRRFTELHWDLQAEMEELGGHLADRQAAEEAVLAQLDRVLEVEAKIKRTQVSMLVGLRGLLTSEQFDQALRLHRQAGPSPQELEMRRRQEELRQHNGRG